MEKIVALAFLMSYAGFQPFASLQMYFLWQTFFYLFVCFPALIFVNEETHFQ